MLFSFSATCFKSTMSDEEFFMLLVITVYLSRQNRQRSLQRTMAFVAEYSRIHKIEAESCGGLDPEILQKILHHESPNFHFQNNSDLQIV